MLESQKRVLDLYETQTLKKLQQEILQLSEEFNPEDLIQFIFNYYYQMDFSVSDINQEIIRELESR